MLEMWLLLLHPQAVLQLLTCERHHLLPQHLLRHPLGPGLPELQELRPYCTDLTGAYKKHVRSRKTNIRSWVRVGRLSVENQNRGG